MTESVRILGDIVVANYGRPLKDGDRDKAGAFDVFGSAGSVGKHSQRFVNQPTIVIGRKGSVGSVTYAPNGGWPIDTTFFLDWRNNVEGDWKYLYYALRAANLNKHEITTSIPGLNRDRLLETGIYFPVLKEQRRITAILDKTYDICEKRRNALELADEFLRSVFLDIFGGVLSGPTNQWQALSDCTDFIDYRGKTPEKSDSGVRLITAKNVRNGVINVEPAEFISEETYSWWMSRGYPQSGDVLFTTEAPLGYVAVLRTQEPVAIGQRLIAIRPRDTLRSDYLGWALRQDIIQRDIISRATGSTVKGIRSAELVQVKIPIPSMAEQLKFEKIVASVHHQKELMQASAVQSEQLFQALQQQAFQGRL